MFRQVVGFIVGSLLIITAVYGVGGFAQADSTYTISAPGSVQIPQQTVTISGDSYNYSSIARVAHGEPFVVNVSGPSDDFMFYLYDSDLTIVEAETINRSETLNISTDTLDPGTYAAVLSNGSSIRTLQPVVIAAYDVNTTVSTEAVAGGRINVTVNVTGISSVSIERIDVTVLSETANLTVALDRTTTEQYTDRVSIDGLQNGSYAVFVAARTNETAFGHKAIIGLSNRSDLRIKQPGCRAAVVSRAGSGPLNEISFQEVLQAVRWWAQSDPIPYLNETLDFNDVLKFIGSWARGETVSCSS